MSRARRLLPLLVLAALGLGAVPLSAATSFDGALEDPLFQLGPIQGDARLREALALMEAGKPGEALNAVDAAMAAGLSSAAAYELRGMALAGVGRIEESLSAFDKALSFEPRQASTWTNLGIVQLAIGSVDEAEASFRAALDIDPSDRRAHQRLGLIAIGRGQTQAAIEHLEAGIRDLPGQYVGVKVDLARLYLQVGRADDAIAILAAWQDDRTAPDDVLQALADAHLAKGDSDAAKDLFARIAGRGTSASGAVGLARLAVAAGRLEEAARILNDADRSFPDDVQLDVEVGNLLGAQGNYEQALARYRDGLGTDRDNPALLKGESLALFRLDRVEDALAPAVRLSQRSGAVAGDYLWLGTLQEKLGRMDAAVAAYERTLELAPDAWIALNNLAAVLSDQDPSRALGLARRAAELAPGNPDVQDTLAWAELKAGHAEEAATRYATLRTTEPASPVLAFRHGLALIAAGQVKEGRHLLQHALDLDPTFPGSDEAHRILAAASP
ncbi:tetratricopeptide repeat protein [Rubellimicrobium arenae]|uniref:tetratricopeptide repeat protein n=1 Tax=Rubellimicrobium arenae TaxID=2817372 RepID=UPI001B30B3B9|nr:tetratricopeptide repeat protein [Rubellimicrobium arenae]